jgi:hypothetical protein
MPKLPSNATYNDLNGKEATEILVDWFRQLLASQPLLQPHLTLPQAKLTLDIGISIDMYVGGSIPVASPPDRLDIAGAMTLSNELSGGSVRTATALASERGTEHREQELTATVSTVASAGGLPPDQVREQHGLPITRPGYGPRDVGAHIFLADVAQETDTRSVGGREGIVADGYVFASEPVASAPSVHQHISVDRGGIDIRSDGQPLVHDSGQTVSAGTHYKSVKDFGDQKGERYGSVNGVQDLGPAGLMTGRMDRSRIKFGNNQRG